MVFATLLCGTVAAQLNPVSNLQWNHWYTCPHNYFSLTWDAPVPVRETLIGYNIYRENELYRFQTSQVLFHDSDTSNCSEDFVMFNGCDPFWMHVTAVYNDGQEESGYVDSAYCLGFAIGMEEKADAETTLYPNPTTGNLQISNQFGTVERVVMMDRSGKVLRETTNPASISLSDLPCGIYYLKLVTGKGDVVKAVIKQ